MPDFPLLSIFIPTFNRPTQLARLLKKIEIELEGLREDVEILVADNSENGDSQSIVFSFSFVKRYLKNQPNIGADRNILLGREISSGEFLWILGDDDFPAPGSVSKILRLCREIRNETSVNLIYLGRTIVDNDEIVVQTSPFTIHEERVLEGGEAIDFLGKELLNVSSFVRRKESLSNEVLAKYTLGWFVSPLVLSLRSLVGGGRVLLTPEKYVMYTDANKEGWARDWPTIRDIYVPIVFYEFCAELGEASGGSSGPHFFEDLDEADFHPVSVLRCKRLSANHTRLLARYIWANRGAVVSESFRRLEIRLKKIFDFRK